MSVTDAMKSSHRSQEAIITQECSVINAGKITGVRMEVYAEDAVSRCGSAPVEVKKMGLPPNFRLPNTCEECVHCYFREQKIKALPDRTKTVYFCKKHEHGLDYPAECICDDWSDK